MANTIITIYIIVIVIFFISIFLKDYAKRKEAYFKKKAVDEGNVIYIPIYAITQGDKNYSSFCFELFFNSILKLIQNIFPILIQPVLVIIHMIKGLFAAIEDQMSVMRGRLAVIRQFLMNVIQTVMEKISNMMAALTNQLLRTRDTLKRFFAVFRVLVYIAQTSVDTLMSFINGPVGDLAKFTLKFGANIAWFTLGDPGENLYPQLIKPMFCFHENTLVKLNKGFKYIKNINIGDILCNNNIVSSKFIFKAPDFMYKLNGDIVSGTHKVCYNNGFILVQNHPMSIKIPFNEPYIYCLNTTNHKIITNNHIYTDYDEHINKNYYKDIFLKLNNKQYDKNISLYPPGFLAKKGNHQNILNKNKNLYGIVQHLIIDDSQFYNYNGIICSGSNIVKHNNEYTFIQNIDNIPRSFIRNIENYDFIHFLDKDNKIYIENDIYRDYNNILQ
tara:strand:+ start:601 stop:1932 length:1332 start_codon:yes stop_codon:yes gene_type:complete